MSNNIQNINKFYDGNTIYNLESPFKFIIGNRSAGKTFFFKLKGVDEFLNNKGKFIIMRRYTTEIDIIKDTFFNDIEEYKKYKVDIKVKGYKIFIENVHAGDFIALSSVNKYKSINMSDYNLIIFDEFIPEDNRYINQNKNYYHEPEQALNFFQTVARGLNKAYRENVKFIFISNSISTSNPYFDYFKINKLIWNGTKKYYKDEFFSFEITKIKNDVESSRFGKFIKGTNYGNYALSNEFYRDNYYNLFKDLPKTARIMFTIEFNKKRYGVFIDKSKIYIHNKTVDNAPIFSLEKGGEFAFFGSSPFKIVLKEGLHDNRLYFCDTAIKNIIVDYWQVVFNVV